MSELLNVLRHVHKIINIFYNFIMCLQNNQISPSLRLTRFFFQIFQVCPLMRILKIN
jgi:hypothetical protein